MLNPKDIDNHATWQWINYGSLADFLEAFIREYPETSEAPTKYATLNGILKALRWGQEYARRVMRHEFETERRREVFGKLLRKHNISCRRRHA